MAAGCFGLDGAGDDQRRPLADQAGAPNDTVSAGPAVSGIQTPG